MLGIHLGHEYSSASSRWAGLGEQGNRCEPEAYTSAVLWVTSDPQPLGLTVSLLAKTAGLWQATCLGSGLKPRDFWTIGRACYGFAWYHDPGEQEPWDVAGVCALYDLITLTCVHWRLGCWMASPGSPIASQRSRNRRLLPTGPRGRTQHATRSRQSAERADTGPGAHAFLGFQGSEPLGFQARVSESIQAQRPHGLV